MPELAWQRTRGEGVLVALVDSGVDGAVAQLRGRVTAGADIVTGAGRGDVDCLGTGTAMASLIAAESAPADEVVGLAPAASVVPIRIATTEPVARPTDQARGIQVAVSTGATVLAIGSLVDIGQPTVAQAVAEAVAHDVLVVIGAPTNEAAAAAARGLSAGSAATPILRVGAIRADGGLAERYVSSSVDIVAPGVGIAALGVSGSDQVEGTGTRYAVAFVAGLAALLRALNPFVTAGEVAFRIMETASRMDGAMPPDPDYGWGMIDLEAATATAPGQPTSEAASPRDSSPLSTVLVVATLGALMVAVALVVVRRRRVVTMLNGDDG